MQHLHTVLLIDDDPVFNMINKRIILSAKFTTQIKCYLYASEALAELKQSIRTGALGFPDVIFLNINMPDMDGWEFLEELKELPEFNLNKCKVCILTSSIDQDDIQKSKGYEIVCDFIIKPLSVDKLRKFRIESLNYSDTQV